MPSTGLRPLRVAELLQLALDFRERVRIEQLPQLRFAEQLAQLRLIDREGLRAPLGQRRIAVVDVVGDVAEEERRRERRGRGRIDGDRLDFAPFDPPQRVDERRHVEHIAEALAVRLEQHRERAELRGDRQEIRGALPLLPQRAPPARPALGQQQRARRRFAELGREQRGAPELPQHERLGLVRRPESSASGRAASSVSGNRTTNPSSVHIVSTSRPVSARARSTTAIAHGAWMRPPNGVSTQIRQSPSSSRQRSTRIVRSSGTTPAAAPDRRDSAPGFRPPAGRDRGAAPAAERRRPAACCRSARTISPMCRPSSSGRPAASAFQNGILPGSPGAGDTSTRSCVISSMRQLDAPSRNVSPTRLSNTISSSSSPTRAAGPRSPMRNTP